MRSKIAIMFSLALCLLSATFLAVVPVRAEASGPPTPKMFIKNYGTEEKEFLALEAGEIDITDWPITKTFIDKWTLGPDGKPGTGDELVPSDITLRDYSELGEYGYGLYNQRWPTGVGDRDEDVLTFDPTTGTYKHYFDPANEWDLRAWQFRLAIMYLVDKDYIKTEILKGYGLMMDTFMPAAISGWLDMANLTKSSFTAPYGGITVTSLVYKRDVTKAKALLDAAGFTIGPDGKTRIDPRKKPGDAGYPYLDPLIFYMRSDHTERRLAGEKLAADLAAIGVPVDSRVVAKTVAFKAVMVDYDYHLYTEGYSLGVDPVFLYQTFHSAQYYGAPYGSKYDGTPYDIGWSGGFQGFANTEFDKYSADYVQYGETKKEVEWGVHNATYIFNKYVGTIPLWASAGVQGYRTGWTGVVNQFGYGISGPLTGGAYLYSLLTMDDTRPQPITTHPPGYQTDTLVWGFKANPEDFNVVSSEWVWDWNVLNAVYDMLIVTNPYNPAEDWPWLATDWNVGEWMYPGPPAEPATMINFTLRQNAKWHHGGQVTPDDIAFSLRLTRDAGPGVAWNFPGAMDIAKVETWDNRANGGGWGVVVKLGIKSYYALHLVGWLPMFSKDIWMAASAAVFGYTEGDPGTFAVDRLKVREYHPWKDNYFKPTLGLNDMAEDGSGPWIYVGADSALMEWYELKADPNFWLTQTEISGKISEAFHFVGDVNKDRAVDTSDMSLIAHALLTTPASGGTPGAWWAWNPDADLDRNNRVDGDDLAITGRSYGMNAG